MSFTNLKSNNKFTNRFHFTISTRFLTLFLLATLFLFSCGKEGVMEEEEKADSPFEGTWTGNVAGNFPGNVTLNLEVRKDGTFFYRIVPNFLDVNGEVTADGQLIGEKGNQNASIKVSGFLEAKRGSGDIEYSFIPEFSLERETIQGTWVVEKDE